VADDVISPPAKDNGNLADTPTGKAKAIRFSTLEAICRHLECQPGDILEFQRDEKNGPGDAV